jgi:hypothetical protein
MKKTLMYCLTMDGITAVYNDADELTDAIKMETDNYDDESLLKYEYTISFKLMTEKEIEELPEFDGY